MLDRDVLKAGYKDPGAGKTSLYILLLIGVSFFKILVEFLNKFTEKSTSAVIILVRLRNPEFLVARFLAGGKLKYP